MSAPKRGPIGLYPALVIVVAMLVWTFIGAGCQSCEDRGGQYVRGVLWYECVSPEVSP